MEKTEILKFELKSAVAKSNMNKLQDQMELKLNAALNKFGIDKSTDIIDSFIQQR